MGGKLPRNWFLKKGMCVYESVCVKEIEFCMEICLINEVKGGFSHTNPEIIQEIRKTKNSQYKVNILNYEKNVFKTYTLSKHF